MGRGTFALGIHKMPTFSLPRKGPEVGDTIEERMKRNLLPSQDKY